MYLREQKNAQVKRHCTCIHRIQELLLRLKLEEFVGMFWPILILHDRLQCHIMMVDILSSQTRIHLFPKFLEVRVKQGFYQSQSYSRFGGRVKCISWSTKKNRNLNKATWAHQSFVRFAFAIRNSIPEGNGPKKWHMKRPQVWA